MSCSVIEQCFVTLNFISRLGYTAGFSMLQIKKDFSSINIKPITVHKLRATSELDDVLEMRDS